MQNSFDLHVSKKKAKKSSSTCLHFSECVSAKTPRKPPLDSRMDVKEEKKVTPLIYSRNKTTNFQKNILQSMKDWRLKKMSEWILQTQLTLLKMRNMK